MDAANGIERRSPLHTVWKPALAFLGFILLGGLYAGLSEGSRPIFAGIVLISGLVSCLRPPRQRRSLGYAVFGSAACAVACAIPIPDPESRWTDFLFVMSAALGIRSCVGNSLIGPSRWVIGPALALALIEVTVFLVVLRNLGKGLEQPVIDARPLVLASACAFVLFCLVAFYRQAIELFLEPFFWLLYAIRGVGPSAYRLPPAGPVLVIANHCSWLDPVFVTKVLPRPITPMMTSRFYDIWFLRPLLKYVFKVIVVPDVRVRREAPELKLAIAALDRGEVLTIFPEGSLRRKDDVPLKRFGQGVWMILKERPTTPVVSCWIEGSWGSYFSYFRGPPTKNKRMDFRTPIRVGMNRPETVPADILEDAMLTRIHLMNRVLAAREHLGLPDLPPVTLPPTGDLPDAAEEVGPTEH